MLAPAPVCSTAPMASGWGRQQSTAGGQPNAGDAGERPQRRTGKAGGATAGGALRCGNERKDRLATGELGLAPGAVQIHASLVRCFA